MMPSSVRTSVKMTLQALFCSCAVHTGWGRGTEIMCVLTDAIWLICGSRNHARPRGLCALHSGMAKTAPLTAGRKRQSQTTSANAKYGVESFTQQGLHRRWKLDLSSLTASFTPAWLRSKVQPPHYRYRQAVRLTVPPIGATELC